MTEKKYKGQRDEIYVVARNEQVTSVISFQYNTYWIKIEFQLDERFTCVPIEAHRWYPVANMTIQHKMRVYDYYEPGQYGECIKMLFMYMYINQKKSFISS